MKKPSSLPPIGLVLSTSILFLEPTFATVIMDDVYVGNIGNVADLTGYGKVDRGYWIAKNETSIAQYAEFLNHVAQSDPYGLYHPRMSDSPYIYVAGINRSGSDGSYVYSVVPGSENKPITFVSWFDAARFCNWLQNGQGSGGTETGAYTLNGATTGIFEVTPSATVWIPSEDEWYKAAYYDPSKNGTGGYWKYPTQSDAMNGNTIGIPDSANYDDGNFVSYPALALTDGGAWGADSASAYGTNDQGGNVFEWNDSISGSLRGLRGGSWNYGIQGLESTSPLHFHDPAFEYDSIGFRIASIPEPTPIFLWLFVGTMILIRRIR